MGNCDRINVGKKPEHRRALKLHELEKPRTLIHFKTESFLKTIIFDSDRRPKTPETDSFYRCILTNKKSNISVLLSVFTFFKPNSNEASCQWRNNNNKNSGTILKLNFAITCWCKKKADCRKIANKKRQEALLKHTSEKFRKIKLTNALQAFIWKSNLSFWCSSHIVLTNCTSV